MPDKDEFDSLWDRLLERAKFDSTLHLSYETGDRPPICKWMDKLEEINARALTSMAVDSSEMEKGILKIDLGKVINANHYLAHLAFELGRQYEIDNQLKDVNLDDLTGEDFR